MSVEDNKALVKEAWDCVSRGDGEAFLDHLTEDATWTFTGTHRFAGTFSGKQEIVDKLGGN